MKKNEFRKRFNNQNYSVVSTFFDWALRDEFMYILQCMEQDCSYDYNGLGYQLPSSYNEWEKDEEGYFDDGVIFYSSHAITVEKKVDFLMYIKCIELACEIYLEDHPQYKEEICRIIQVIKNRYL